MKMLLALTCLLSLSSAFASDNAKSEALLKDVLSKVEAVHGLKCDEGRESVFQRCLLGDMGCRSNVTFSCADASGEKKVKVKVVLKVDSYKNTSEIKKIEIVNK